MNLHIILHVRRVGSDSSMSAYGSASPGFNPRRGNFQMKIFNLGARRGRDVHFLIARLYNTSLDKIPNPSAVCMLRRHIIPLIAIRPSDGDVKSAGPLDAFREEQAMSRHRVSPSPFSSLSSSSHALQLNYTTQTLPHTVTLTSTSSSTPYRYS